MSAELELSLGCNVTPDYSFKTVGNLSDGSFEAGVMVVKFLPPIFPNGILLCIISWNILEPSTVPLNVF